MKYLYDLYRQLGFHRDLSGFHMGALLIRIGLWGMLVYIYRDQGDTVTCY